MLGRNIIVVGASAGGVDALTRLVAQLPAELNAAIFIVLHIGAGPSRLPEILARSSKLPVCQPIDGQEITSKRIYVAPPDMHMVIVEGCIRLVHGPKENFTRPAIDPLFRSAAIYFGTQVVGVVLTGRLDDGSAGLIAIKDQGGVAIVQSPAEAFATEMPENAIASAPVDHIVNIADMGALLIAYNPPEMRVSPVSQQIEIEHRVAVMDNFLYSEEEIERFGLLSPLTCPDCHGSSPAARRAPVTVPLPRRTCHVRPRAARTSRLGARERHMVGDCSASAPMAQI